MQQGIKKLQWLEYLKVVFLEILNPLLCRVFANQVTFDGTYVHMYRVIELPTWLGRGVRIGLKHGHTLQHCLEP